jgi:hypothetical protein
MNLRGVRQLPGAASLEQRNIESAFELADKIL